MFSENFINRVITAAFILAIMLAMIFINGYVLLLGCIFLSLIAIYEINNALKRIKLKAHLLFAYIFNIIFILVSYFYTDQFLVPLLSIYLIAMLIAMILLQSLTFENVIINMFLAIYITLSYSYFIIIREPMWLIFTFGISSVTDSFAYLVGMTIGKHKLNERLSPKKTIEGSVGGIIGAVLFTILFKYLYNINLSYSILIFMAIILSVISQLGDLIASYIKRKTGIKDYGYIFKGHGGVMDRFDSVLLISPIIVVFISYI